jgi:hypothetical protein
MALFDRTGKDLPRTKEKAADYMKRFLSFALVLIMLAVLLPAPALAADSGKCGPNLNWDLDNAGKLTISGTGDMDMFTFTDTNYPPWYSQRAAVKTVEIESGATSIGRNAFSGCTALTAVSIPSTVTRIEQAVFSGCTALASVVIPNTVTSVGDSMFVNCGALTSVTFPSGMTSFGSYMLDGCTSLASVTIPSGVTSIGSCAFRDTKITGIALPTGLRSIGTTAFQNCKQLTGVTIPSGVTEIGLQTFYGCESLTGVTLPNGLKTIGVNAFNYSGLTGIAIPNTVTEIGSSAFAHTPITALTIPNSVTSFAGACMTMASLQSVTLPTGITAIGYGTFMNCSALTGITIPSGVTSIGDYAFFGCSSLAGVTIPEGVTAIGPYAFTECHALTAVSIPAAVTSIGQQAFARCAGLTGITVTPANPNYTSDNGVLFNKNKTTLIQYPCGKSGAYAIPSGVKTIDSNAFSRSASLTGVTIPSGVTYIAGSAFAKCTSLTSVTIPDTVTVLGSEAFAGCTSLESATVPISVVTFESAMYVGTNTFGSTAPGFVIFGVPGSKAYQYAISAGHNFMAIDGAYADITAPETINKPTVTISGMASGNTVNIYVGNTLAAKDVPVALYGYSHVVTLPSEGIHVIRVETTSGSKTASASATIKYDANHPTIQEFYGYSAFRPVQVDLMSPDGVTGVMWYAGGTAFSFEVKLDMPRGVDENTKLALVFNPDGAAPKKLEARYDPGRGTWIATDSNPNLADSGKVAVECEWVYSNGSYQAGTPDQSSSLLMYAQSYTGDYKGKTINPNSGAASLAPGLTLLTMEGSKQWVIRVTPEAVGAEYLLWAHANSVKEYISVTFTAPGDYKIGNANGMNHLAMVRCKQASRIGFGKYRIAIDPSGYVYEAVPGNRLPGVKATAYHTDNGTASGKAVLWNAKEYEQANPLYTDGVGYYRWDVPQGWWQVKYELSGYETAYSDWFPVPPEQTDVNIGMVSKTAPIVQQANGYPDSLEIVFSKYMQPNTINAAVAGIPGTLQPQNLESDGTNAYASVFRFVPDGGAALSGTVQLTVSNAAKSYANVAMASNFSMNVSIKPEPAAISANDVTLAYDAAGFVKVTLDTAAAGMTVTAVSDNPYIVSVAEKTGVDASGNANVAIKGNLPGSVKITFSLQNTLLKTTATVTVGPLEPGHTQTYAGVIVSSTTPDNAFINLTDETVALGFTVAAYSVNGGKKWKKGPLPEGMKFNKLFDKGMELHVADKWNDKNIKDGKTIIDKKGVAKDSTVIKFPKINARPKANAEKLKPYYLSETWELRTKTGGAAQADYEWAGTTDKKNPSGAWQAVFYGGMPMLSGKAKTTYLFRAPASAKGGVYTPASKIFKVAPANYGKAPTSYKVKTDGKTGKKTVKLKANDWYQLGTADPVKVTAAIALDVTEQAGTLTVWKGETGKKPRSEKYDIAL